MLCRITRRSCSLLFPSVLFHESTWFRAVAGDGRGFDVEALVSAWRIEAGYLELFFAVFEVSRLGTELSGSVQFHLAPTSLSS